jgi:ACDE family multidrug resistance protein
VLAIEHVGKIQPIKAKKSSRSDSKKNPSNQKWAVLSISSIPLVMTLGNSMLIPVLPMMENEIGISPFQSSMIITIYSIVAIILIPLAGFFIRSYRQKKSNHSEPIHYSNRWTHFCMGRMENG